MTVKPEDVARAVVTRQIELGNVTDKIKLQKLLYLVQGAHLVLWGEEAFSEEIRAYRWGPVVRRIQRFYYSQESTIISEPMPGEPLPRPVSDTVDRVVEIFGAWRSFDLADFTKQVGSPWRAARQGVDDGEASDAVIPPEAIAGWFRKHGIGPAQGLSDSDRTAFERLASGDPSAIDELIA